MEAKMAYMNQEMKATIKAELDKVLKGTGIKYSLGVRHNSTLVLNISHGPVDFIGNYNETVVPNDGYRNANSTDPRLANKNYLDVNPYHYRNHFSGEVKELLIKVFAALNLQN